MRWKAALSDENVQVDVQYAVDPIVSRHASDARARIVE
jgi:hypothetical protein